MARENQDEITFDGLLAYLKNLGFSTVCEDQRGVGLRHDRTQTLLLIEKPTDGRTVSPADLLSIETRLDYNGLVPPSALERFRTGRLPVAS